jgi:hypothetical protein
MNEERSKPEGQQSGDIQEPGSGGPAAGLAGLPADYPRFLTEIKARIAAARTPAVLAVNSELIWLYWEIGHKIFDRSRPVHRRVGPDSLRRRWEHVFDA